MKCLRSLLVVGALATTSAADETRDSHLVVVPAECVHFWSVPEGGASPAAWDALLSFAACIQDVSAGRIETADDIDPVLERLQLSVAASLRFYEMALAKGPATVQLRAAYHVGLGQVALVTRARNALVSPALRPELEQRLVPHVTAAYLVFTAIGRAAASDPSLTPDVVTRNMVQSAREIAASLRSSQPAPADEGSPIVSRGE
jgi:hypothetical protein